MESGEQQQRSAQVSTGLSATHQVSVWPPSAITNVFHDPTPPLCGQHQSSVPPVLCMVSHDQLGREQRSNGHFATTFRAH